jgi:prepilin-type N-terminal cleavage/methylation domain-containing protein
MDRCSSERGVSLIETMCAISIVAVGLLGLAGVFTHGMVQIASSQSDFIAKEKCAEAVESVISARDTRVVTWAMLRNEQGGTGADGGVFLDGPELLRNAGADGLVNTRDDTGIQMLATPGPDNQLGTADDEVTRLEGFTREIEIRDINPTLRQIRVVVTYPIGRATRSVVLTTLMSTFS